MPYDDPDIEDPQELVGVELPGDELVTREMAAAFADEFAQLGFTKPQILALYRATEYAGAHQAWRQLGDEEIARMVDESLAVWSRVRSVIVDCADGEAHPLRLTTRGAHGAPARERGEGSPRATEPGCGAEPHVTRS